MTKEIPQHLIDGAHNALVDYLETLGYSVKSFLESDTKKLSLEVRKDIGLSPWRHLPGKPAMDQAIENLKANRKGLVDDDQT